MTRPAALQSAVSRNPSSLNRLVPVGDNPLRHPASSRWVWASLLLALLISLLPWRNWPYAPDLLLGATAFWALHEPRRVGLTAAFVFGLLLDVHDTVWLGSHAAVYVMTVWAVVCLQRRLQRFGACRQALHLLAVLGLSMLPVQLLLSWLAGRWLGWGWLGCAVLTAVLWPLLDALLHWPQRRVDDDSAA